MKTNNSANVVYRLVKALGIRLTQQSIISELDKHPERDSLLAMSDVLNNYNIPNASYQLAYNELHHVPMPFVTVFSGPNNDFVLVEHMDDQKVVISNDYWDKHHLPADEFRKLYGGYILLAENEPAAGEADYAKNRRKEILNSLRVPFIITAIAVALITSVFAYSDLFNSLNIRLLLLSVFKCAGVVTAVLLLIQSIDANNPIIQKLCGGDNNKNCNAILTSKAAMVTDGLSWSEVGFFYFTGTLLALVFNSGNTGVIQILAWLNVLSLPYTVYSIYYQYKVARQWCVFCCTVQGLLWLEFFADYNYLFVHLQPVGLKDVTGLIIALGLPIVVWIFIKPILQNAQQTHLLKQQLSRFKYNTEMFNKLLNDKVKYSLLDEKYSLILGNRNAQNTVTIVSNPFCQPCAKAHKAIDSMLTDSADVRLQIVFATNNADDDPKVKVASRLLAIRDSADEALLKRAVNDWYETQNKGFDNWAQKYPVTEDSDQKENLIKQFEWNRLADITSTPTIFVNGRRIPESYQPEDLKYFLV